MQNQETNAVPKQLFQVINMQISVFLFFSHPVPNTNTHTALVLTCNADVGTVALGGASRAPGHTLAPVVLQTKQLLHLSPGY